jgi:hypothetical protein
MHRRGLRSLWVATALTLVACGATGGGGCGGCGGFTQYPQGTYAGPKLDSAGAVRVSQQGFSYLNSDAGVRTVLSLLAPGGTLRVPVPCTTQTTSLLGIPVLNLTIADEGSLFCTSEACGQMDGRCTSADVPREVTIRIDSLRFAPKSPDIVEAVIQANVQTGELHIASTSTSACLLGGGGRIKCSVDFDTARAMPAITELGLNLKLAIDTRWDRLLALEVTDIDGTNTCSGGNSPPSCIDGADITLARPPGASCSLCTAANFGPVKNLLIGQLADSLKTISELNCAPCSPTGTCPRSTAAGITAMCVPQDGGPGTCVDSATGACVPGLLGVEGRLDVSSAAPGLVPPGSEIEFAFGVGGSAAATTGQGATIGLRGGVREVQPAACVAPRNRPMPMAIPLPDFDRDAPAAGYDVAFSLSQQVLADSLYRVQQSGALCLELGTETVSLLESGVLSALLPSLELYTEKKSVPLRVVVRPVNPPTVVVGEGTVMNGVPADPLLLIDWPQVELDVYALLEDRYARLFTVQADLKLPFSLDVQGCDQLQPVIGSLRNAIQNVQVKNNELLAESPDALAMLVPQLLSLAEPQLAQGLPAFTIPDLPDFAFKVQLVRARGVGQVTGTSTYNHLGLYARLYPRTEMCPAPTQPMQTSLTLASREADTVRIVGLGTQPVSFRVDQGFWSMWQPADDFGQAVVQHPRLMLGGRHVVEVRGQDGRVGRVEFGVDPVRGARTRD